MLTHEHDLQVACVRWFRMQYPHRLILAVPNGGKRHKKTAVDMKAEGQLKGVPDLFVPEPNNQYAGLWVEMKVKPNKPSEEQVNIMRLLENRQYKCEVCYSFEQFVNIIRSYISENWKNNTMGAGHRGFIARND